MSERDPRVCEFFSLAGIWLMCRFYELHMPGDKTWFFLGCMDFQAEMGLLLKEAANATVVRRGEG